jgi:hypothetical protein
MEAFAYHGAIKKLKEEKYEERNKKQKEKPVSTTKIEWQRVKRKRERK